MKIQNQTMLSEFIILGFQNLQELQYLLFSVFLTIYLFTMLWNTSIITIAILDQKLRTPMYFFLGNLSFLDICYTTHMVSETKTISYNRCMAQMNLTLSCGITECFILALMAYDRYVAICWPLRYPIIMRMPMCVQMAGICWFGGFFNAAALTVCTVNFPFCGPYEINHFFCEAPAVLQLACLDTYMIKVLIFALSVIVLMLPLGFIVLSYLHIARVVFNMNSTEGRQRAFSTCATHLTIVVLFYSTICFTYLQPQSDLSADQEKKAAVFYCFVSPMLNPVIYSLRNKDVKEAFVKVMGKVN
uniref:Olfactory receptor n=1 Tax=Naja naja TaxID=35670 RepID=A0A8C6XCI6_NAJNA